MGDKGYIFGACSAGTCDNDLAAKAARGRRNETTYWRMAMGYMA